MELLRIPSLVKILMKHMKSMYIGRSYVKNAKRTTKNLMPK